MSVNGMSWWWKSGGCFHLFMRGRERECVHKTYGRARRGKQLVFLTGYICLPVFAQGFTVSFVGLGVEEARIGWLKEST
jgi:hypothetical protein